MNFVALALMCKSDFETFVCCKRSAFILVNMDGLLSFVEKTVPLSLVLGRLSKLI